jgi:hypothetical protein
MKLVGDGVFVSFFFFFFFLRFSSSAAAAAVRVVAEFPSQDSNLQLIICV